MNLLATGAFAAFVLAAPAHAQDEAIRFEKTQVYVGAISDEQSVFQTYTFVNVTKRPVMLAMSYCHFCPPPLLDRNLIRPGETGTLVLELDPTGKRGPASASVTIGEEGRPKSNVEVELKADVCPRVWVEPIHMFPKMVRGEVSRGTLTVTGRTSAFKIEKVDSDVPLDGIDLGPVIEVEDCGSKARSQNVTIRFPKDAPLGHFSTSLKIVTSDDQGRPRTVAVDGQVVGRVTADPETVGMRAFVGQPFRATFDVLSSEGPLLLQSLDITKRDEATSVVIDAMPTSNPSKMLVTVVGIAPLRERQHMDMEVEVVARTLVSGEEERITVPISIGVVQTPPTAPPSPSAAPAVVPAPAPLPAPATPPTASP